MRIGSDYVMVRDISIRCTGTVCGIYIHHVYIVHSSITLASPSIYHISTSRYMTIINHDVALSTHQLSLEFYIYAMPIHGSVCRNAPRVLHFSAFILARFEYRAYISRYLQAVH